MPQNIQNPLVHIYEKCVLRRRLLLGLLSQPHSLRRTDLLGPHSALFLGRRLLVYLRILRLLIILLEVVLVVDDLLHHFGFKFIFEPLRNALVFLNPLLQLPHFLPDIVFKLRSIEV